MVQTLLHYSSANMQDKMLRYCDNNNVPMLAYHWKWLASKTDTNQLLGITTANSHDVIVSPQTVSNKSVLKIIHL